MTDSPDRRDRTAELRSEMDARVDEWRERPLPAWLRSSATRHALALTPAATFVLGIGAAFTVGEPLGVVALVLAVLVGAVGTVLLRRATRMLDAAPHGRLDERELAQRDRAFRRAFRLALGIVGMLWLLAVVDGFTAERLLDGHAWVVVTLAAFVAMTMVPAATLLSGSTPANDDD